MSRRIARSAPALLAAVLLVLSAAPAATASAADIPGDFNTYRGTWDYGYPDSAEGYIPAPGYEYTDEGFQTVPPDYTNAAVYLTVQTKEPRPVRDGVYLDVRIDEFPYKGEDGTADEWISFHIWNTQNMSPGYTNHGSGWQCLIRGDGGGADATFTSLLTTEDTEQKPGEFLSLGTVTIEPVLDDEDREHYIFAVEYTDEVYRVMVNGVEAAGADQVNEALQGLSESGDFYIGITMQSTVENAAASLTITQFGTDRDSAAIPRGSDSKLPEENVNVPPAALMDSDSVPTGQPALRWDAERTSFVSEPGGENIQITAQGDGSYHCLCAGAYPFFAWEIRRDLSYEAKDFPVFAMLLRNYLGYGHTIGYGTGEAKAPVHSVSWYPESEENRSYFHGEDDYLLVLADLSEGTCWDGRINVVRPGFSIPDYDVAPGTGDNEFDILWMGMFRSEAEVYAYTDAEMSAKGVAAATDPPTASPTVPPADPPAEQPTEQPVGAPSEPPTAGSADPAARDAGKRSGCASSFGSGLALTLAAAVAAAPRRRRRVR